LQNKFFSRQYSFFQNIKKKKILAGKNLLTANEQDRRNQELKKNCQASNPISLKISANQKKDAVF
jgi:hypothetical protein